MNDFGILTPFVAAYLLTLMALTLAQTRSHFLALGIATLCGVGALPLLSRARHETDVELSLWGLLGGAFLSWGCVLSLMAYGMGRFLATDWTHPTDRLVLSAALFVISLGSFWLAILIAGFLWA